MSTFEDEEILIQHSKKTHRPHLQHMTVDPSSQDCQLYGHSWQVVGTAGTKCCTQCGIIGYRPGCTLHPPKGAQPFDCTKHTLRKSEEVQL
jgi:hypothetical protein